MVETIFKANHISHRMGEGLKLMPLMKKGMLFINKTLKIMLFISPALDHLFSFLIFLRNPLEIQNLCFIVSKFSDV